MYIYIWYECRPNGTPIKPIEILMLNPLSPHDALKHHFTSLKTYLIFLQLGVLE